MDYMIGTSKPRKEKKPKMLETKANRVWYHIYSNDIIVLSKKCDILLDNPAFEFIGFL